jgi:hypothetical protein
MLFDPDPVETREKVVVFNFSAAVLSLVTKCIDIVWVFRVAHIFFFFVYLFGGLECVLCWPLLCLCRPFCMYF